MTSAHYRVRTRSLKTLKLIAEIDQYAELEYTRTPHTDSDFMVGGILSTELTDPLSDVRENALVEILRQPGGEGEWVTDYIGVNTSPVHDDVLKHWTLAGPSVRDWMLSGRVIDPGASEFDAQEAVAGETAMKHYVTDHLVNPSKSYRSLNDELGVELVVAPDLGRGGAVSYNARFQPLPAVTEEIGRLADLHHDVVLANQGYEYRVGVPLDKSDSLVFSVMGKENVKASVYKRHLRAIRNAVFVLGEGEGASRNVEEVEDANSISTHFRREAAIDARDADSAAKREDAGRIAIAKSLLAAESAEVEGLAVAGTERYREHYDLWDTVTVRFETTGRQVQLRIEQVRVRVDSSGEQIQLSFGEAPDSLAQIIAKRFWRTQRSEFE